MNSRTLLAVLSLFLAAIILAAFTTPAGAGETSIALIKKVVLDVWKKSLAAEEAKAGVGEILIPGDEVRTGTKSFALIKFKDNSIVRLRERSRMSVVTEGQNGEVRAVRLTGGAVGFDVKKQQAEHFRLTSPTSVAAIRGTKGKWSGGTGKDTLTVTEGLVNLLNKGSNKSLDIPAGYIGFSYDDGTLTSRRATESELADATIAATGGDSQNELKFELKDPSGKTKQLKLKYKQ
jgi:hypothetical protein